MLTYALIKLRQNTRVSTEIIFTIRIVLLTGNAVLMESVKCIILGGQVHGFGLSVYLCVVGVVGGLIKNVGI